jgi:hypothetical protein
MGLLKNPTNHGENQDPARRKRRSRCVPRTRRCLLKGCEQSYRPRQPRQRYCSGQCRKAARAWSRWKAQQRYRVTVPGKQQRNGQSRRYRERVRNRKPPAEEAVPDAARVITTGFFSMPVATGPAATQASRASGARRCNGSARTRAGVRWNASLSASGAGSARTLAAPHRRPRRGRGAAR